MRVLLDDAFVAKLGNPADAISLITLLSFSFGHCQRYFKTALCFDNTKKKLLE